VGILDDAISRLEGADARAAREEAFFFHFGAGYLPATGIRDGFRQAMAEFAERMDPLAGGPARWVENIDGLPFFFDQPVRQLPDPRAPTANWRRETRAELRERERVARERAEKWTESRQRLIADSHPARLVKITVEFGDSSGQLTFARKSDDRWIPVAPTPWNPREILPWNLESAIDAMARFLMNGESSRSQDQSPR